MSRPARKPAAVLSIYDSKEPVADRYTVVLDPKRGWERNRHDGLYQCIGLSARPDHPQGVSQFSSCRIGRHLGRKIPWGKLPANVRDHVRERLR